MAEAAQPPVTKFDLRGEAGVTPGRLGQEGIGVSKDIAEAQRGILGTTLEIEGAQGVIRGYEKQGIISPMFAHVAREALNSAARLADGAAGLYDKSVAKRKDKAKKWDDYFKGKGGDNIAENDSARQTQVLQAEAEAQNYNPDVIPGAREEQPEGRPGWFDRIGKRLLNRDRFLQGEATKNAEKLRELANRLRAFGRPRTPSGEVGNLQAQIKLLEQQLKAAQEAETAGRKGFEGLMTQGKEVAAGDRAFGLAQPETPAGLADAKARTEASAPVMAKIASGK